MEERERDVNIQKIAQELIESEYELQYIRDSNVRIVYLKSNVAKHSGDLTVYGECEKVPGKYKWTLPADFTITIYWKNCSEWTEEQMRILVFHELLHIGIKTDGEQEIYFTKQHDLSDFKIIIDKFGTGWSDTDPNKQ